MRDVWKVDYQLVPPNLHRRNAAKYAICTFKAHSSETLTGIAEDLPPNLWDVLITQT